MTIFTSRKFLSDETEISDRTGFGRFGADLDAMANSPLSLSSMSEDVQTSPKSIINWMDLLCRNYYCFRVMPYHHRLERALKKESKYFLWDWAEVENDGARFENMIASHLLKFCDFYRYVYGIKANLWYIRDREGREVDFLVSWGDTPWFMVEAKLQKGSFKNMQYFAGHLNVSQKFMVTLDERHHFYDKTTHVHVIPASKFLMALV